MDEVYRFLDDAFDVLKEVMPLGILLMIIGYFVVAYAYLRSAHHPLPNKNSRFGYRLILAGVVVLAIGILASAGEWFVNEAQRDGTETAITRSFEYLERNWRTWLTWLVVGVVLYAIGWAIEKFVPARIGGIKALVRATFQWIGSALTIVFGALLAVALIFWALTGLGTIDTDDGPEPTACKIWDTFDIEGEGVLKSDGPIHVQWTDGNAEWHAILPAGEYMTSDIESGSVDAFDTECSLEQVRDKIDRPNYAGNGTVDDFFDRID